MQPGDTITPGQQPTEAADAPQQATAPQATVAEQIQAAPVQSPVIDNSPQPSVDPVQPATYAVEATAPQSGAFIRWTASEYVDHAKGSAWFVFMGVGLAVGVGVVYVILRDIVAAVLLAMAGITFGIFAGRRPQVLEYAIDDYGIHIGNRVHPFDDFKTFSLIESGPLPAILLTPLKRFLPPITVFYDPQEEEAIVTALADYLPHEDREPDAVDRLMSRIRF